LGAVCAMAVPVVPNTVADRAVAYIQACIVILLNKVKKIKVYFRLQLLCLQKNALL
jgi:hypothetical protein